MDRISVESVLSQIRAMQDMVAGNQAVLLQLVAQSALADAEPRDRRAARTVDGGQRLQDIQSLQRPQIELARQDPDCIDQFVCGQPCFRTRDGHLVVVVLHI